MTPRFACVVLAGIAVNLAGCARSPSAPKVEKDKAFLGRPLADLRLELKDPDVNVRRAAVKALSHASNAAALESLRSAVEDADNQVAEEAVRGIGWLGADAAAAVPTLTARLQDPPTAQFRQVAIETLGRIGPKSARAVPLLIEQYQQVKELPVTRRAIVITFGQIGPEAKLAVPTLIEALAERDLEADAVVALIRMGAEAKPAVAELSKRLRPEEPHWLELVQLLADIDPQTARAATADLRKLAESEPVRDRGIVNFRMSEQRIDAAKKLVKRLEDTK